MIYKLSETEKTVHDVKMLVDMGERNTFEIAKSRCREEKASRGRMIIFRSKEVRHG
jgi:hypothetical protein